MDPEAIKWAIGQGGLAVAFIVLFHFYRKDVKSYTELWRGVTDSLIVTVKENTASNTKLIVLIDALHRRLDESYQFRTPPMGSPRVRKIEGASND